MASTVPKGFFIVSRTLASLGKASRASLGPHGRILAPSPLAIAALKRPMTTQPGVGVGVVCLRSPKTAGGEVEVRGLPCLPTFLNSRLYGSTAEGKLILFGFCSRYHFVATALPWFVSRDVYLFRTKNSHRSFGIWQKLIIIGCPPSVL